MRCPNCKENDRFHPWEGTVEVLGIELPARGERCQACGKTLFDAEEVRRQDRMLADALVERGIRAGNELKLVRKAAELRALDVADLLDVNPETVSRWETGKVPIPAPVAYVVAELYEHPRRTRSASRQS